MRRESAGAAIMALSAACFSLTAIFAKLAYAGQVNLITTLSARSVLAALVLWAIVWLGGQTGAVKRRDLSSLFIISLIYLGFTTFFMASLERIPASLASLLLYTYPTMVVLYEVVACRYPLGTAKTAALVLTGGGLMLVLGNISGRVDPAGVLLGLGCAVCSAAYVIYGQKVTGKHPPLVMVAFIFTFAAVVFTPYGLATGGLSLDFPAYSWIWLVAIALIPACLGNLLMFIALIRVEAGKAAIIGTSEVVMTVSISALFLGDRLTPLQLAGGLMVLAGIIVLQLRGRRRDKGQESVLQDNVDKQVN